MRQQKSYSVSFGKADVQSRLISISLTNLTKFSGCKQLLFFDKPGENTETHKSTNEKVDKVIDDLRKRYGFDVIKRCGVMKLDVEVDGKFKEKMDAKIKT